MATFLIDMSPGVMADRLSEALRVYVTAMGYPPGTERQRAAMWLEHTRRSGWRAVAAFHDGAVEAGGGIGTIRTADAVPVGPGNAELLGWPTGTAARGTSGGSSRWCSDYSGAGCPAPTSRF